MTNTELRTKTTEELNQELEALFEISLFLYACKLLCNNWLKLVKFAKYVAISRDVRTILREKA